MTPSVSIIMSVFNGERFIADSIKSMLAQTFVDYEFLVVDDGSSDSTWCLLSELSGTDGRVRLFRQENHGLTFTLNHLVNESKGMFIARMDADDISLPDRLQKQISLLEANPDVAAVGTWFRTFGNPGHEYERFFPNNDGILRRLLREGHNCYAHGSVMFRKDALLALSCGYRLRFGQDFDLWLRLSDRYRLAMVEEVLYLRRDHPEAMSASLVPRRKALMGLMLKLAREREAHGCEITDWAEAEASIFRDVPLWTAEEVDADAKFMVARKLLLQGRNYDAKRLLLDIPQQLRGAGRCKTALLMAFLPTCISRPLLRLREFRNSKRLYSRNV